MFAVKVILIMCYWKFVYQNDNFLSSQKKKKGGGGRHGDWGGMMTDRTTVVLALSETTAVRSESTNKFPCVSKMTRTDSYELLISPYLQVFKQCSLYSELSDIR